MELDAFYALIELQKKLLEESLAQMQALEYVVNQRENPGILLQV